MASVSLVFLCSLLICNHCSRNIGDLGTSGLPSSELSDPEDDFYGTHSTNGRRAGE
jgi:hypothetical protein